MAQQVTITTETSVALKALVESALQAEARMLDLSLQRTRQRLDAFEQQYNQSSEEFEKRFIAGEIEESFDFIEWAGELHTYRLLDGQRQALQGVEVH